MTTGFKTFALKRIIFAAILSIILAVIYFIYFNMLHPNDKPYLLNSSAPFSQVWVSEDETAAHISLQLVYPYGERANPYELGLAHYVEHLTWHNVRSESDN